MQILTRQASSGAISNSDALISKLRLDNKTSEPYYQQLIRRIQTLITSGELQPGLSLPAERVLAQSLRVSRTTIKRCYDELRKSGQLSTHGRGGTAIRQPAKISPTLGKLKGFVDEMHEMGMTATTRLIEQKIVTDRAVANLFNRPEDSKFLRLVRVRLGDGIPMSRETAWYDLSLAPKIANWSGNGSMYAFLHKECGIGLGWAEQSIEAVMSSREETKVFEFSESGPCLLFKRRSYTAEDTLVEYVEGTFRGDAYNYKIKLSV